MGGVGCGVVCGVLCVALIRVLMDGFLYVPRVVS
jgi:hypothetical protein